MRKEERKVVSFPLDVLSFNKDKFFSKYTSSLKKLNSSTIGQKKHTPQAQAPIGFFSDFVSSESNMERGEEKIEAQALQSLEPEYPALSRRKGEEGICIIKINISSLGLIENISLEKSSGFNRLDKSALEQVKNTRFSPAKQNGLPIASEKKITFRFELKK